MYQIPIPLIMPITRLEYEMMQRRCAKKDEISQPENPVDNEGELHSEIIKFCDSQWPRWKWIRARMDKKSTLPVGCHDFTIFASGSRVFCFECKKRGAKPDVDQRNWIHEMKLVGTVVHVIYNFEQFKEVVNHSPQCPWPESVWPMTDDEYVNAIPDENLRTAISGFLMRKGWLVAINDINQQPRS